MTKHELFGFQVEIDEEATGRWYAQADEWGCECGDCRNFLKIAHERALPAPVLEILDKLGIPPEKATYVCMLYNNEDGYLYELSYRLAGRILSGDEMKDYLEADWGTGRCWHEPYPYGAPGFPEPHFDIDFTMALPWVLDEPRA